MNFWLSWKHYPKYGIFELHSPWWISGEGDDYKTIVAAVKAESEKQAKDIIEESYDVPLFLDPSPEWRFCDKRPDDWSPFCDRFPRADWMIW